MKYPKPEDFGVRSPDLHNTYVILLKLQMTKLLTVLVLISFGLLPTFIDGYPTGSDYVCSLHNILCGDGVGTKLMFIFFALGVLLLWVSLWRPRIRLHHVLLMFGIAVSIFLFRATAETYVCSCGESTQGERTARQQKSPTDRPPGRRLA